MVICAAYGCNSRSEKKIPGLSFHRFPQEEDKRSEWLKNMRITDWVPTKNNRLCSKHFEKRFFYKTNQKVKLLNGAIPKLFPELSMDLQHETTSEHQALTSVRQDVEPPTEKNLLYELRISQELETVSLINNKKMHQEDNLQKLRPKIENTVFAVHGENPVVAVQDELKIDVDKFPTVCRSCLRNVNVKSIFKLKYKDFSFHRIFESCTSVQVAEGDDLPQNICFLCVNEVIRFYKFILKTQQSDILLNAVLSKHIATREIAEEVTICEPDCLILTNCDTNKVVASDAQENEQQIASSNVEEIPTETKTECFKSQTLTLKQTDDNIEIVENDDSVGAEKKPIVRKKRRSPNTFSCTTCSESFLSFKRILEHCRKNGHPKPRLHKCPTCDKAFFNRNQMLQHTRTHTKEKPYMCYVCGARFSINGNLRRHIMTHTGEKPHICEVCGKGFIQAPSLVEHRRTHTGETPFVCPHCNKGFSHACRYKQHVRGHLLKNLDDTPTTDPEALNDPKLFEHKCKTCGKVFSSKAILKTHSLIHGEKSYLCSDCGKGFVSKAGLQSHTKIHTGDKPYTCALCHKSFTQHAGLRSHFLIHTGQKPFACKVCGKAFTQRNHLMYHMRTHSGERPYSCSFCGKSFALKGTLTVHIRTHTGETPYVCDVCGKGFYDSSSMKKHRRGHAESDLFAEPIVVK